jgi:4-hydroxybenzoate polyprenyltransferase
LNFLRFHFFFLCFLRYLFIVTLSMRSKLALYLDLIRWNRPAGWLLLLWPTLSALWIASHGWPGWHLLTVFTLGTILMRSAGCCINDVADADFDKHVKRTANRPVTSGKIGKREALLLGAALALCAFGLVLTTNALTILYSFAALAIAIAYPFAKRFVGMPQAVLGVAFSFGIPMAFAAASGDGPMELWVGNGFAKYSQVSVLAWWLLLGNLFWVLAYDTEYAMVDRDDDLKTGMKTSAITLGRWDVPAVLLFYGIYLSIWLFVLSNMALVLVNWTRIATVLVVAVAALAQVAWHYRLIRSRSREGCFAAFRANHWLGFTLFAGVVAAHWAA